MISRNDPCPCGSGKKYKKCCLPKDRAERVKSKQVSEQQDFPEEIIPTDMGTESPPSQTVADDSTPTPDVEVTDPLLERINAFWDDFLDASYEDQWTAVTKMLAEESELCDGEMVFEIGNALFGQAIDAGEIDRYKKLLDQLEKTVPDAYAEELHYILEWRIQIALIEGDEAGIEHYFYHLSPLAGDQLDLYYRMISPLAYHGKLAVLHEGMRQARPFVAEGGGLVEWAYTEFIEKLGDIEIIHLLSQNPDLKEDDPTLQQRMAEYELTMVPEMLSDILDYRTGRRKPSWTRNDFKFSGRKKNDPAKRAFALLLAAFTHFAHVEEGIPRTKVEMARNELSSYISQRHAGELDEYEDDYGRRPKRRRRKKSTYALCPDAKTFDRYLAQSVGFMSFRYYEAFALFELLPAWLRFLTKYELLDEETRMQTVKDMSYLKDHIILIATKSVTDPNITQNIVDWPYDFFEA